MQGDWKNICDDVKRVFDTAPGEEVSFVRKKVWFKPHPCVLHLWTFPVYDFVRYPAALSGRVEDARAVIVFHTRHCADYPGKCRGLHRIGSVCGSENILLQKGMRSKISTGKPLSNQAMLAMINDLCMAWFYCCEFVLIHNLVHSTDALSYRMCVSGRT